MLVKMQILRAAFRILFYPEQASANFRQELGVTLLIISIAAGSAHGAPFLSAA